MEEDQWSAYSSIREEWVTKGAKILGILSHEKETVQAGAGWGLAILNT